MSNLLDFFSPDTRARRHGLGSATSSTCTAVAGRSPRAARSGRLSRASVFRSGQELTGRGPSHLEGEVDRSTGGLGADADGAGSRFQQALKLRSVLLLDTTF